MGRTAAVSPKGIRFKQGRQRRVQSSCQERRRFIPIHFLRQKKMFPPCLKLGNHSTPCMLPKIHGSKGLQKIAIHRDSNRKAVGMGFIFHQAHRGRQSPSLAIVLNDEWNGPYCKNMSHSLIIPTAYKQNPNPHMQQPSVTWPWPSKPRMVSTSPQKSHWRHNIEIVLKLLASGTGLQSLHHTACCP